MKRIAGALIFLGAISFGFFVHTPGWEMWAGLIAAVIGSRLLSIEEPF